MLVGDFLAVSLLSVRTLKASQMKHQLCSRAVLDLLMMAFYILLMINAVAWLRDVVRKFHIFLQLL